MKKKLIEKVQSLPSVTANRHPPVERLLWADKEQVQKQNFFRYQGIMLG